MTGNATQDNWNAQWASAHHAALDILKDVVGHMDTLRYMTEHMSTEDMVEGLFCGSVMDSVALDALLRWRDAFGTMYDDSDHVDVDVDRLKDPWND